MTDTPLQQRLLDYLKAPGYAPQDSSAIARGMGIASTERAALRALLREWEDKGRLVRLKQSRYILKAPAGEHLTGRIRQLGSGKMLFIPDPAGQEFLRRLCGQEGEAADHAPLELPVMRRPTTAMDGDLVHASIRRTAPARLFRRRRRAKGAGLQEEDWRLEARIDAIVERKHPFWVGLYRAGSRYGSMEGDGRTCPGFVRLTTPPPPELQDGMCITVQPQSYALGRMEATGKVESVLGWPEGAGVEIAAAIRRYSLRTEFPEAALAEAAALPSSLPPAEWARREDWRQRCVITIDPATARDYDDAIALRPLPKGGWELAVHIADVAYYVQPGSALDAEARLRGNSTYLPDRVLPMLPPRLCDDLCSLKQGEERPTRLCLMRISPAGVVTKASFHDAIICSCSRLTYPVALSVLEGRASTGQKDVDELLLQGHQLAQKLRRRRLEQGALNLDMPEVRVIVDSDGRATGVETESSDIAHQMIEEFMLAANEAVARALKTALIPTLYRVHEAPDATKLREFALTVNHYGIPAGSLNSREELRQVMEAIQGHPDEHLLHIALLKAMMRARYSPKALGHFGLAKGDYCHFTSPIRRYADLIVHRGFSRLVPDKGGIPPLPDPAQLASLAEHLSETERNSAAAEQEAQQARLARFMQEQCAAENPIVWQAVVTSAWAQGLAVDIPELQMRGYVSPAALAPSTRWFYEHHSRRWSSTDGRSLLPGSTLHVIPLRVDPVTHLIDFGVRPAPAPPRTSED